MTSPEANPDSVGRAVERLAAAYLLSGESAGVTGEQTFYVSARFEGGLSPSVEAFDVTGLRFRRAMRSRATRHENRTRKTGKLADWTTNYFLVAAHWTDAVDWARKGVLSVVADLWSFAQNGGVQVRKIRLGGSRYVFEVQDPPRQELGSAGPPRIEVSSIPGFLSSSLLRLQQDGFIDQTRILEALAKINEVHRLGAAPNEARFERLWLALDVLASAPKFAPPSGRLLPTKDLRSLQRAIEKWAIEMGIDPEVSQQVQRRVGGQNYTTASAKVASFCSANRIAVSSEEIQRIVDVWNESHHPRADGGAALQIAYSDLERIVAAGVKAVLGWTNAPPQKESGGATSQA